MICVKVASFLILMKIYFAMKHKKHFTHNILALAVVVAFCPAYAETQASELETVQVVGSMYKTGDVPFRQAKSATALNQATLEQQNIDKADELGRYQAGFTTQVYGNDSNTNWFTIRGKDATQAIDGNAITDYGFFKPRTEMYGFETVEITKGADALTFGAAKSGGLVNYISKRPHKEAVNHGEVKIQAGNNNQYGIAADYTGALNADKSLRYRVVGSFNHADGEWDGTDNKTFYIAPSITWDIAPKTSLTVLSSYQKDKGTPSSNFLPQHGTLVATDKGYISRDSNLGDPNSDFDKNRQFSLGYEFNHEFKKGLTFTSNYRYSHVKADHQGAYVYPSQYSATWSPMPFTTDYTLSRGVVINHGTSKMHSLDNRVNWRWKNNWLDNTLVAGVDYRTNRIDGQYDAFGSGRIGSIDVFNTATGHHQTVNTANVPQLFVKSKQLGMYLNNQARIAKKVAIGAGIRHDRAETSALNLDTLKKNHTSYSGSIMWLGNNGVNPYYSYSQAFTLPMGISATQKLYEPNITKQHEIGVKYSPDWTDATASLAYFKARDTDAILSTINANGTMSAENAGQVKREGVEAQISGQLNSNWSANFAYSYLKSVTEGQNGAADVRNPLLPKHNIALMTTYRFDKKLNGLTLGVGVRHARGSVTANGSLYSGWKVPAYTVWDLMGQYQFNNRWLAQLNVDNVGNKRYLAGCDYYCYYGAGRNIKASLSYRF